MRLSPAGHQPSISWSRVFIIIIIITFIISNIMIIIIINTGKFVEQELYDSKKLFNYVCR